MKIPWTTWTVSVAALSVTLFVTATANAAGFPSLYIFKTNGSLVPVADIGKKRVRFQPPMHGAPTRRIGGATRNIGGDEAVVAVLAPPSTGLSGRPDPTLYWYTAQPSRGPVTVSVTVIAEDGIDPIAELEVSSGATTGLNRLSLAKHGVELQPDVVYEWSVAAVFDPTDRAKDILSAGTVMYRRRSPATSTDDFAMYAAYLEDGYWYDAVELVVERMRTSDDRSLWQERYSDLMSQVGLEFIPGER